MWHITKILPVKSFTFRSYKINRKQSSVSFYYVAEFKFGLIKTFRDTIYLPDVVPDSWDKVPSSVLESTLQSLLLMLGINYWSAFRTSNIKIEGFTLNSDQAKFWESMYLNGLGEFFYQLKIDFRDLIKFPFDDSVVQRQAKEYAVADRALLLHGAGKDSILSAEMLKASNTEFDFFAFSPTPAHNRTAKLVDANIVSVRRKRDLLLNIILVGSYPSVSTYTFVATLLAQLNGYNSIITSNEKSADFGNLTHLGLEVNHQWCKSTEAEEMINNYIQNYVTPSIKTHSLLRKFNELEIVQKFVAYPKYLFEVTSCNSYFWLPPLQQKFMRKNYWCNRCPKCVFLFACYSAYLPKDKLVSIFGDDLYNKKRLLPLFSRILGIEGTKPLDCVGEPEEMIMAMQLARQSGEYEREPAITMFDKYFPDNIIIK